jgi:hypothetical protein
LFALLSGAASAVPVSTFDITVPRRAGAGLMEINALKITLQLNSSANIALNVKEAQSGELSTQDMVLANATNDCFAGSICFSDFPNTPAGAVQKDRLAVVKPMHAGAEPASSGNDKLVLILRLRSNSNEAAMCTSTMVASETWTVSVVGGAARITAVSVQSLDKNTIGVGNPACGTAYRPVPLSEACPPEPGACVAKVVGQPQLLAGGRVGVDAVMVLDRSGSMSGKVTPDAGAPTKRVRLGEAAETFIDMWAALRANECQVFGATCPATGGVPGIQGPTDRLGVVFFDHNVNWLKALQGSSQIDGLKEFSTLNLAIEKAAIKAVNPSGATSIGGGMVLGAGALAPALSEPNRKIILLMSDGQQNTLPLAQVNLAGTQVETTNGGPATPLPNQPPIQIYGVTVGKGVAVDPTINQAVSTASNGFYLNTEDDAAILPNLFVQVLQNAVKYSSVETLRVIADQASFVAPFQTTVPITTTTHSLAFNLTWKAGQGQMRVTLIPPAGAAPIVFAPAAGATPGLLTGNIAFPHGGVPVSAGDWTVRITTTSDSSMPTRFNFALLGDDAAINSSLGAARGEVAVGGNITLTAQVNDLDRPITGLGSQPDAQVQVFVVRPGNSLGDVLSDTAAAPVAAGSADASSSAQRKLEAILAANPNALLTASDVLTMAETGGPGIYRATIPARFEGHYNFVFLVQGRSESGGRFVRQQIRTVHVRSLPDPGATQYTSHVVNVGTASVNNVLVLTTTPRNVNNGKLGPGWANYLWFAPPGLPPRKGVDNLDGSYTAQVPFSGSNPPSPVSLHFLPEPVWRPDTFIPEPGQLTAGNQIVADVTQPPTLWGLGAGKRAVWLALGSTYPSGSFSNSYKRDLAANVGFEYGLGPTTAIEATIGLHRFKGKSGAPDVDVTQYGVNGKWYFPAQQFRPFVTLGLGGYSFDPGSNRFGGNAGAGVQFDIAPQWSVEGRYTFHSVSGNSPNSRYSTLQLGLRYSY